MISYLQLQNFIRNNKGQKIFDIIEREFINYVKANKIKTMNPLTEKFHNGKLTEKKIASIFYFNEYLTKDERILKVINDSYGCTNLFFHIYKSNKSVLNYIEDNLFNIIEYISIKNSNLHNKIKLIKDANILSKVWFPYLSLIEEYVLLENKELYFSEIINLKKIYFDYLHYVEKMFKKNKNIELDKEFINKIKYDSIIMNKYMNILFNDSVLNVLEETLLSDDNNLMIFLSMKNKYFKNFINQSEYVEIDFNLLNNYFLTELFNNNNIIFKDK